ncbi:MAG: hypothetical protein ACD_71C00032G0002 [uncultured bacterium (gcode 4)]|uniref:Uncharacterized protein n=1 Tax=uncultured bacterium (gcode 4) TaxID=1234023 RepID=K2A3S7_9BACT|nr:MAG: hypothetical protein ACD_71C00032G0002 [uncultured bacterium (gcode 4)]
MKINKIVKYLKEKVNLGYWFSITLSTTLLIWILWQIIILSKFNAIVFFSWSQIFSDTAILFIPVLALFSGHFSYKFLNKFKIVLTVKARSFLFLIEIIFILWVVYITLCQYLVTTVNLYFLNLTVFFLFWFLLSIFDKKVEEKKVDFDKWIFAFPALVLSLVLLLFLILLWIFNILYHYIYTNIYVNIDNTQYKVQYMNDKYIIYWSWNVIPNDWKNRFVVKDISKWLE